MLLKMQNRIHSLHWIDHFPPEGRTGKRKMASSFYLNAISFCFAEREVSSENATEWSVWAFFRIKVISDLHSV